MGGADWARTKGRVSEALAKIADGLVELYAEREIVAGLRVRARHAVAGRTRRSVPVRADARSSQGDRRNQSATWNGRGRWTGWCAATSATARPKSRCARRSKRSPTRSKSRSSCRRRCSPRSITARSRSASPRFRCASTSSRASRRSKEQQATLAALADGQGRRRRRHAPAAAEGRRLPRSRADRRRRRAALRRDAQGAAQADARDGRRAHALGDADPAHAADVADGRARSLADPHARRSNRMSIKTVVVPSSDAIVQHAITDRTRPRRPGVLRAQPDRVDLRRRARARAARARKRGSRSGTARCTKHELEPIMAKFIDGEIDVFVSTTIIENGIDIPNVNTIIVNDADKFGLAQLYQLRGRVGRSNHQAYAFLLYQAHKALSEDAKARLEAIREFTHLGSGLADRDARSRDSRRRQLARRGAVRLHRRGRLRDVRAAARRGDRRPQGRAARRRRARGGDRREDSTRSCPTTTSRRSRRRSPSTSSWPRRARSRASTTSSPACATASARCPSRSRTWSRSRACACSRCSAGVTRVVINEQRLTLGVGSGFVPRSGRDPAAAIDHEEPVPLRRRQDHDRPAGAHARPSSCRRCTPCSTR